MLFPSWLQPNGAGSLSPFLNPKSRALLIRQQTTWPISACCGAPVIGSKILNGGNRPLKPLQGGWHTQPASISNVGLFGDCKRISA